MWKTVIQIAEDENQRNDLEFNQLLDIEEGHMIYYKDKPYDVMNIIFFLDTKVKLIVIKEQ